MKFHATKFEVLKHGKNKSLKEDFSYFTLNNDDIIERKEVLRNLGIQSNYEVSIKYHINKVCRNLNRRVGRVLQKISTSTTHIMKLLWKQLVQEHIDYGNEMCAATVI